MHNSIIMHDDVGGNEVLRRHTHLTLLMTLKCIGFLDPVEGLGIQDLEILLYDEFMKTISFMDGRFEVHLA